jgi:hypothetical protein
VRCMADVVCSSSCSSSSSSRCKASSPYITNLTAASH